MKEFSGTVLVHTIKLPHHDRESRICGEEIPVPSDKSPEEAVPNLAPVACPEIAHHPEVM
jgi:hypothetical protein